MKKTNTSFEQTFYLRELFRLSITWFVISGAASLIGIVFSFYKDMYSFEDWMHSAAYLIAIIALATALVYYYGEWRRRKEWSKERKTLFGR